MLRSHSISFTGAQGVPKYKGRGKGGRGGVGLVGGTGDAKEIGQF